MRTSGMSYWSHYTSAVHQARHKEEEEEKEDNDKDKLQALVQEKLNRKKVCRKYELSLFISPRSSLYFPVFASDLRVLGGPRAPPSLAFALTTHWTQTIQYSLFQSPVCSVLYSIRHYLLFQLPPTPPSSPPPLKCDINLWHLTFSSANHPSSMWKRL